MEPNYERASSLALDVATRFGFVSSSGDLLRILHELPGVFVVSMDMNPAPGKESWDAFTCVREKAGALQYIIMYNSSLLPFTLRHVLARELGHVVLEHDGLAPEDIWMQESDCFAYHLLAFRPPRTVTIYFRPDRKSVSASFKEMMIFDSLDTLKQAIADDCTRRSHFIGRGSVVYHPADVEIRVLNEKDIYAGWKNFCSVTVAGRPVGFCGE